MDAQTASQAGESTMTLTVDITETDMFLAHPGSPDGRPAIPDAEGVLTVVAGTGAQGGQGDGGKATAAELNSPAGLLLAGDGTLFIADRGNHRVRKVTPDGLISTVAGEGTAGYTGDDSRSGTARTAQLNSPTGLALDAAGNLYIADWGNYRVRKVTPEGEISLVAGDGSNGYGREEGVPTEVSLGRPANLMFDAAGSLFIAEETRDRVRKMTDGKISSVPLDSSLQRQGDPPVKEPAALCMDEDGSLYIADEYNHRVWKVAQHGITTFAGTGHGWFGTSFGFSGDGGPANRAKLYDPCALARDAEGNLYIADRANHRVRKVDRKGVITTIAGPDTPVSSGSAEQTAGVTLRSPRGLAVDPCGNLYISDSESHLVWKLPGAQERNLTIRQVKVPRASLGETAELTVEITAYHAGRAVDAGNIVQRFTAPTGFTFAEWPTYSYNGDSARRGSLGCYFESGRRVMIVTSNLHLNTCDANKGPLVYTIPVKADTAVDPGTYHDGQLLAGRHPGIVLSATVTAGPRFSVTAATPSRELVRGVGLRYPGVVVQGEQEVPRQTVRVTLPSGAGLAFVRENVKHQMTVKSHSKEEDEKFDAVLSADGRTLTCANVDLGLSQEHPKASIWVAVEATAAAPVGSTHLTFQVGGIVSDSTGLEITEK
ncbi:NHL repeat-containing protein [Streptomyces cinereoruber]|uniref:NHL repeat-containing protein n=3 Tax=Streptomyces cinereoruber TaxID=67260 RepID=UPI0036292421